MLLVLWENGGSLTQHMMVPLESHYLMTPLLGYGG